jgi:hypothetical protein
MAIEKSVGEGRSGQRSLVGLRPCLVKEAAMPFVSGQGRSESRAEYELGIVDELISDYQSSRWLCSNVSGQLFRRW